MVTRPDRSPDVTLKDLVSTLVTSASATEQRERLGRLLPRLDSITIDGLDEPGARALARTQLSEAFLVALGPDAAQEALSKALDDTDAIFDVEGRTRTLVEAAHSAAALGSFGTDLLARIEAHASSLDPSPARARLLATLSVAYGKARDAAKASKLAIRGMNSAEKVEDLASRVDALVAVAVTLHGSHASRADAREAIDRAMEVARGMSTESERARALLSVAAGFGRIGLADEGLGAMATALGESLTQEVEEVVEEAIEEVVEEAAAPEAAVEEIVEEPEPVAAAAAPTSPSLEPAFDAAETPEGYVDPVAGVKFPNFKRRR